VEYSGKIPGEVRQFSVRITGHDLIKCSPEIYVNDIIIEFFLKFLLNELIEKEKANKVYIFSTYFFDKYLKEIKKWRNTLPCNQIA